METPAAPSPRGGGGAKAPAAAGTGGASPVVSTGGRGPESEFVVRARQRLGDRDVPLAVRKFLVRALELLDAVDDADDYEELRASSADSLNELLDALAIDE
jgi:hypothetical protein